MKIVLQQVDQQLIQGILKKYFILFYFSNSLISNDDEQDGKLSPNQTTTTKDKKHKISSKEESEMIRARAFLNRLDNKIQEKDEIVKQIR